MTSSDQEESSSIGPPPRWDPELGAALEVILTGHRLNTESGRGIPELQQVLTFPEVPLNDARRRYPDMDIDEHEVPGPRGDVAMLVIRPGDPDVGSAAICYLHAGGMITGSSILEVEQQVEWARTMRLTVLAPSYRLAPEHPHPAPIEDCYATLCWIAANADELGIDADRLVIAGPSAGGGLAAASALMARDQGGPSLVGQMLLYPMLDDRNNSPSVRQMAGIGIWDQTANDVGWRALLGADKGGPAVSPYAAPARATDLSGLPPAYLDVGSAETFRDEVVEYASRIWQAGGEAELHVWPGAFHAFDVLAPQAVLSRRAREARMEWLRRVLG